MGLQKKLVSDLVKASEGKNNKDKQKPKEPTEGQQKDNQTQKG